MFSLPLIAETQFAALISGQFTGSFVQSTPTGNVSGAYEIHNGFSLVPVNLPLILVVAGKFKEIEPFTHVYDGDLTVSVLTQIDDASNPVALHDGTVSQVYDILSNSTGVTASVEASNFHLYQYYSTDYDHGRTDINGQPALTTHLTYRITCMNSGISAG